jgi:hypothetical protein
MAEVRLLSVVPSRAGGETRIFLTMRRRLSIIRVESSRASAAGRAAPKGPGDFPALLAGAGGEKPGTSIKEEVFQNGDQEANP